MMTTDTTTAAASADDPLTVALRGLVAAARDLRRASGTGAFEPAARAVVACMDGVAELIEREHGAAGVDAFYRAVVAGLQDPAAREGAGSA